MRRLVVRTSATRRPLWDDCLGPTCGGTSKTFSARGHTIAKQRAPAAQMDHSRIFINYCTAKRVLYIIYRVFVQVLLSVKIQHLYFSTNEDSIVQLAE